MKATLIKTLVSATMVASVFAGGAHAAGTASFSLGPNSGSHVQGTSFTVQVRENGDNINVVNAKLTYDPAKLSCNSIGGSTAFPATVTASCSNGSVTINRYTNPGTPAVSGTQVVGTINFTALANSGSTSVVFAAGSQIVSGGANVWNGSTTGGTYGFTAPAVSTPQTPVPATTATSKTTTKTTKAPAVEAAATTATPTATSATTPKSDTKSTETPAKKTSNSTTAWIIGGLLAAAAAATGALYAVNKRREAMEAAAAAAAARKKATSKKPSAKRPAKSKK